MRLRRPHRRWLTLPLLAALALAAVATACGGGGGYQVSFVFAAAPNVIVNSSPVKIAGQPVGLVSGLELRDGKALVRVTMKGDHVPLPQGTSARLGWVSVAGQRFVDVAPGPKDGPRIKSGAVLEGSTVPPVELYDVLNGLDPPTRDALTRALPQLDAALAGREQDLNATVAAAGPAVDALGDVLGALGQDGPALRQLVTSVRDLAEGLNERRDGVRTALTGLETTLTGVASREEEVRSTLEDLPGVLGQAKTTLARIPTTAASAIPLLQGVRPVVEALPGLAADLRPLAADLTPLLLELRPALVTVGGVLADAPDLLDRAHATVPPLTAAVTALAPAVAFLRPYTPELAGAVANLASATASYDAEGHYVRFLASSGSTIVSPTPGPGNLSPFVRLERRRAPGQLERHSTTDAAGRIR